ncbi:MAG: twitching motility protein, partial [Acidobacteria bacterium]
MAFFDLDPLLETMLDSAPGISDLNLSVGRPPQVEVDGQLHSVSYAGIEKLLPYHTEIIAMRLLATKRDLADKLVRTGSVDLSYSLARRTRFRVNVFSQRGSYSIVLRVIPNKVPTVEELGIPPQLNEIASELNGIVLVTGPTGSGKSTTLAAIINKINREKPIHVITIEDPIEYLHPHNLATINQREVGSDTQTFALALRAALRQAPKVILVGEMRDVETISIALEASETGHLVLSTLHTIDAAKTIDRIVGVFPKNEERQIRTRFAQAFKWVVSQRLVPKMGGGRIAVCEVLRASSRTREYVQEGEREGKSLLDAMSDGRLEGMQTFDSELERLINAN